MKGPADYDFRVEVRGERACFTMPVFGAERRSYPYPTPSALRGLLEAVYWKPEFRIEIVRIGIIDAGTNENITRSELKTRQTLRSVGVPDRTLRSTGYLLNVAYLVEARIVPLPHALSTNPHKTYTAQMLRRLQRGAHFQTPYLGLREFVATVRLVGDDKQPDTSLSDDVGPVFFGNAYIEGSDEMTFIRKDRNGAREVAGRVRPMFFDMKVVNGWIDIPRHLYDDLLILEGRNAA